MTSLSKVAVGALLLGFGAGGPLPANAGDVDNTSLLARGFSSMGDSYGKVKASAGIGTSYSQGMDNYYYTTERNFRRTSYDRPKTKNFNSIVSENDDEPNVRVVKKQRKKRRVVKAKESWRAVVKKLDKEKIEIASLSKRIETVAVKVKEDGCEQVFKRLSCISQTENNHPVHPQEPPISHSEEEQPAPIYYPSEPPPIKSPTLSTFIFLMALTIAMVFIICSFVYVITRDLINYNFGGAKA